MFVGKAESDNSDFCISESCIFLSRPCTVLSSTCRHAYIGQIALKRFSLRNSLPQSILLRLSVLVRCWGPGQLGKFIWDILKFRWKKRRAHLTLAYKHCPVTLTITCIQPLPSALITCIQPLPSDSKLLTAINTSANRYGDEIHQGWGVTSSTPASGRDIDLVKGVGDMIQETGRSTRRGKGEKCAWE